MNNYINFMKREKGWMLDELFINEGYPFREGDTYYTIEGREIVRSCWDDISEEMYDKQAHYFETRRTAMAHLENFTKINLVV
jgi:hypothetical protein